MNHAQWLMKTKIGPLYLLASEKGLKEILWEKHSTPMVKSLSGSAPEVVILAQAVAQIEEYLNGKRKRFDLPLDIEGTEFQKRVWKQLLQIPYGKTASYKDIASKIKNEKAYRAVGNANGKNPLCIIFPCHRVIAADGSIGGFSGDLKIKVKLLELERELSSEKLA